MTPDYQLSCEIAAHQGPVRSLALGPFGEIVSGGQDALVKRWQGTDDVGTLLDHDHWVTSLASLNSDQCSSLISTGHLTDLHANGIIVTGCQDTLIRVFSSDGSKLQTLSGHTHGVISLGFTDDGYLVSGSWDGSARVWDLSTGECVSELDKHENGVNVAPLQGSYLATCSTGRQVNNSVQDFKLRIWDWKTKQLVNEAADHEGSIRSVDASNDGLVTSSNDGTVHFRALTGETIAVCTHPLQADGHPPYVLQARFHGSAGEVISAGEDGSVCVWQNGQLLQTIQHPAGVWCVLSLANGDFATGGHDSIIRIWSRAPERMLDDAQRAIFESNVKESIEKRNRGPTDAEVAKLPLWDSRSAHVGKNEGFVQLFNKSGKAIAAQWSAVSGTWIEVGEVTGMMDSGSVGGVQFDHVYDVELETAMGLQTLQLGYNNGENPFVAAQRFIDANMLPQGYLAEIADYITQRSKSTPQMLDMSGSSSSQPMDVESRSAKSQRFASPEYILFSDTGDIDKISNKLWEFNQQCDSSVQLSEREVAAITALVATLRNKSYWHSSTISPNEISTILRVLRDWPSDRIFPALDLLRIILCHPHGPAALVESRTNTQMVDQCISAMGLPSTAVAPVLLSLRAACNIFKNKALAQSVSSAFSAIVDRAAAHAGAANKPIRAALTTLIFDVAVAVSKGVLRAEDYGDQCLSLLNEILQSEQTPDILLNAATAAGIFVDQSSSLKSTARDLDFAVAIGAARQHATTPELRSCLEELSRLIS